MDDPYETDILTWSDHQATLLRRVANGECVNGVDWPRVIAEIADVGISERNAMRGLLGQAVIHLLKIYLSPEDQARPHWQIELDAFLAGAADRYARSMRQRIDVGAIWSRARATTARYLARDPRIAALPLECPWTLEALLANDHEALLATLPHWSSPPDRA